MKQYLVIAIGGAILAAAFFFGYHKIISLEKHTTELTNTLTQVTQLLESEVERSARVEASTERLEAADAERQQQLRGFERNLSTLARSNADAQAMLRSIIPDAFLDGLRSYENTRRDLPGQSGSGAASDAP